MNAERKVTLQEYSYLTQFALIAILGLATSGWESTSGVAQGKAGTGENPRLMPADVPALFKLVAATETDRCSAEAGDRGAVRCAYLQGLGEGIPCPAATAASASS